MSRPLTVVHLTLGLDVGGQEKLLVEFARHADRRRFALHFVSLTTRGALAGDLEACGWPVTALDAPSGLRPGLVAALARLLRRLRADVVHTHDDRPNIHGAPAARLAGVRRVIHTRHSQGTRLTPRQRWLVRAVSLCNDRFVCISRDSARHAVEAGVSRRRVVVLPNGIDLERFAHTGPDPAGPAVLVARLAPEKDIGTLLEAVALLGPSCPDFRLEIAGDGPCRTELVAQAGRLGLGEYVRFLGVVRDVPALLARARLFVLSSVTEGISLTLLEAMARGLPVVATDVGGNPEVIDAGKSTSRSAKPQAADRDGDQTGLLVPARDPSSLADAVRRLWTDPETCARIGVAGRRRVERLFDVRRMVAEYEAMYAS
jgi:glycosyltransferase involved in cell wall biosynthesis